MAHLVSFILLICTLAFAHGTSHHERNHHEPKPTLPTAPPPQGPTLEYLINERYQQQVQPIFEKKCFDCHTSKTTFPWYYKLPGIRQMIDEDISDAKEHLNMETGFPFQSHATPAEDLKAIAEEVEENEMPPMSYKLLHQGAALTPSEKETVKSWVEFGLQALQKK